MIASKIKQVLQDGNAYTIGELWQIVNKAEVIKMESISDRVRRLRVSAKEEYLTMRQVENSIRGLNKRGWAKRVNHHPKIFAGDKTYVVATPVTYYEKV